MASPRSWRLPLDAVTLLLGDAELGAMPLPFEPSYPYTERDELARFRAHTYEQLGEAGAAAVREVLTVFATAPVAVITMALLDDGVRLLARTCLAGEDAVRVAQRGDELVFTEIAPTGLAAAAVELVPDGVPAPGSSITVPAAAPPDDADSWPTGAGGALAAVLSKPACRGGVFVPCVNGTRLPPLAWFDTVSGEGRSARQAAGSDAVRRFSTSRVDADGKRWTTYVPGDNARIVHTLRDVLARHAGQSRGG